MDVSTLAIIAAAGAVVIAGAAYFALPREEDYFELSMIELFELTSGSGHWSPDDPESGGRVVQSSQRDAPVSSAITGHSSYRGVLGVSAAATDGAAVQNQGGPVLLTIEGNGPLVPVQRDRPVLFRIK